MILVGWYTVAKKYSTSNRIASSNKCIHGSMNRKSESAFSMTLWTQYCAAVALAPKFSSNALLSFSLALLLVKILN